MKANLLPTWLVSEAEREQKMLTFWQQREAAVPSASERSWQWVLEQRVCVCIVRLCLPKEACLMCVVLISAVWKEQRRAINKDTGCVGHSTIRTDESPPPPKHTHTSHKHTGRHTLVDTHTGRHTHTFVDTERIIKKLFLCLFFG